MRTFSHKLVAEDIEVHNFTHNFDLFYEISTEDALFLYAQMLKLFIFENYALKNFQNMRGFLHLGIGQESIYASLLYIIRNANEYLFIGSYRCHYLAYISGSPLKSIACEILGRKSGMSGGKAGSMHLFNENLFGGHGIVGAQTSLGVGLAFGLKYLQKMEKNKEVVYLEYDNSNKKQNVDLNVYSKYKDKKAVFVFLGDGATNQGQLYESYNLALVHKLNVIFVIENNQKGMWTDTKSVSDTDAYFARYMNMPGIRINSDNVLVLACVFQQILNKQEFPLVVQIDTKRVCAHSAKDEDSTCESISKKGTRLEEMETLLIDGGYKKEVEFLQENIDKEIKECWDKALKDEIPDESALMTGLL